MTNQILSFLGWNCKFYLHVRAEVPSKKLTCIRKETVRLVVFVKKRRKKCEPESSFYLTKVKCSTYVSYIIIAVSVWSYGNSKCSETNVHLKERMNRSV